MIPQLKPRVYARPRREPWGVRPDSRKPNSHVPHYVTLMQDALARRTGPLWTYETMREMGEKIDDARRILREGSISALAISVGRRFEDRPIPRSTLRYWLDRLISLRLIEPWDETTKRTAAPRYRGDGRHKTVWVINTYDRALDLIAADPNIATPKNRTFWVLDGRPLTQDEAIAWRLDVAVAERMPQAWENNARFYDPNAPMKPARRTERPAALGTGDIETIHNFLAGDWQITSTAEQAAEILRWARADQPDIPATALAALMAGEMNAQIARDRKSRTASVFTVKFFARDRVRGLASVWHKGELRRKAEEARHAARLAEHASTWDDPPARLIPVAIPDDGRPSPAAHATSAPAWWFFRARE